LKLGCVCFLLSGKKYFFSSPVRSCLVKLKHKIALVTGASRGIGRAIALDLAKEGAAVFVHYSASEAKAFEVAKEIEALGGKAFPVRAALETAAGVESLYQSVDALLKNKFNGAKLDILVNNAGVADYTPMNNMTEEQFDKMFAVNVKAVYFGIRSAISRLNDNGRIVNISSLVSRRAFPDLTAYCSTKGAVDVMTFNFAKMLGERGITVNSVQPGATLTDMSAWLESPQGAEMAQGMQALKRVGKPEDIAKVVTSVVADMGWVTGETIAAGGGWVL
jgi:3-oxoacyl-[acyl-carrier protein] reductase